MVVPVCPKLAHDTSPHGRHELLRRKVEMMLEISRGWDREEIGKREEQKKQENLPMENFDNSLVFVIKHFIQT